MSVAMQAIQDLAARIAEEFELDRIILFGSHADGSADDGSDVDLLVLMPFVGNARRKSLEILEHLDPRFPVDLVVRTSQEVRERVANNDWFLCDILEKGLTLYETTHA